MSLPDTEVLDFKTPMENHKTLFIWNILPNRSEEAVYDLVFKAFSALGLLYLVRVFRNAAGCQPGFYAVVKFYSGSDATRARDATHGRCLFQEVPLKVRICTKQHRGPSFQGQKLTLNSSKCQEVANYYLGFNGWSSHIITLQNISDMEDFDDDAQQMTTAQTKCIKYLCVMEIQFTKHMMCCRGVGLSEELVQDGTDPLNYVLKVGRAQKSATQKAMSDAFQKILLVVLGNGKVFVQRSSELEELDSIIEEELHTQLQVNSVSLSQSECENLSDFSFDTGTMEGIEK
ncbi:RAD52 motif-containing protein 1 isoform X1 [Callorhinchus milii]|uniref:RAD52 motif-containing protein 1 n=1 Tax=Callorhinchus milii TaxID=7868 RepID=A0A4W3HUA8_CALMI|nr:RAD52 motif-containing protein 1 isoform X1 [Callorhinchus milii]|eukprot:gi/632977792/ref/XP_007905545.1/ PREDICTED: RAD52 motif-containing protein 1 isoform X1 [Callorhinchus milii]